MSSRLFRESELTRNTSRGVPATARYLVRVSITTMPKFATINLWQNQSQGCIRYLHLSGMGNSNIVVRALVGLVKSMSVTGISMVESTGMLEVLTVSSVLGRGAVETMVLVVFMVPSLVRVMEAVVLQSLRVEFMVTLVTLVESGGCMVVMGAMVESRVTVRTMVEFGMAVRIMVEAYSAVVSVRVVEPNSTMVAMRTCAAMVESTVFVVVEFWVSVVSSVERDVCTSERVLLMT